MEYLGVVVLVDTNEYDIAELFLYEDDWYVGVNEDGGMVEVNEEDIIEEFNPLS